MAEEADLDVELDRVLEITCICPVEIGQRSLSSTILFYDCRIEFKFIREFLRSFSQRIDLITYYVHLKENLKIFILGWIYNRLIHNLTLCNFPSPCERSETSIVDSGRKNLV